ncbi:hypothetical protein H8S23_00575 [Anaerofilum sp. BX8]|uniref:Uncharacterized protein n=1 Tax=Anaerofilum hominis TaxID=2763016 RepID=A0A923KUR8_9FIRM|nr:hypothetical protein [Anaerofilum hominis]MBC5579996.1 hypothetical protein [Anaerofilum hominis]
MVKSRGTAGRLRWGVLAAAFCGALILGLLWLDGAFLARWQQRTEVFDPDGDGRQETFLLERRSFAVLRDGETLWGTDGDWKVEDYLHGDLDGDGAEELLLLVWKRGSYGPVRPFWVESDGGGYSQHIFIYRWADGLPQPVWMSSALQPQVRQWSLEAGRLNILTREGETTSWAWRTWGLERVDGGRTEL